MSLSARYESIAAAIDDGSLGFPTSVGLIQKIQRALDNPDCSTDQAARLLQAEPLLAAKLVRMANSVAYNPAGREVSDLRTAIARLGFRTLRSMTMAAITREMAGANQGKLQALVNQLWEHTAYVAAIAHVLARRVTHVDPEAALFAAITHEISGFYLLSLAPGQPELLDGLGGDWVDHGEPALGRALLRQLDIPASIVEAHETYWEGYLAIPSTSLGDTLMLAEELAPVASPLRHPGQRPADPELAARVDMIIGQETLLGILAEADEEVRSLTEALQ